MRKLRQPNRTDEVIDKDENGNVLSIITEEKINPIETPLSPRQRIYEENNTLLTQNETVNKPLTNYKQTINKPLTNYKQYQDIQNGNRKQTVNETVTINVNKPLTNYKQTVNKNDLSCLVGLQKKILLYIFENCKISCSKITNPISNFDLAVHLETGIQTVKTSMERLKIKGYISRNEFKNGRAGWTKYELNNETYNTLLQTETVNKLLTNRKQTVNETVNETVNKLSSSSSSYLINNKTTTSEPFDYENFTCNISKLEIPERLKNLGFTHDRLKQCFDRGYYPKENAFELIQDSLYYIDFNLHHEKGEWKSKKIDNVLNYVMPQLNKAQIAKPQFYKSEKEIAHERMFRELSEKKERENKFAEEIFDSNFELWYMKLKAEEKKKIVLDQEGETAANLVLGWKRILREYYREVIFEKEKHI